MAISLSAESVNSVKLSSVVVFRFALAFTKKVHVVVRNDHIAYLPGKIAQLLHGFTSAPNVGNQCVLIMSRTISKFFIFLLKLLVTTWITC